MNATYIIAICAVVHASFPAIGLAQDCPSSCDVDRLVADAATVEFAARGHTGSVDPASVESVEIQTHPVGLWRAGIIGARHQRPFLVAVIGDRAFPMGGFSSPKVDAVSAALGSVADSVAAIARSHLLATLLDANGAERVAVPDRAGEGSGIPGWVRPSGWPVDGAQRLPDGRYLVTQTLLSLQTWTGYGAVWEPLSYGFLLRPDGGVDAWAVNRADPIVLQPGGH